MIKKIALVALPLAIVAGCLPTRVLVSENFIGGSKVHRSLFQNLNQDGEFNYYERICDIDQKTGETSNCQETLIVDKVYP